MENRQPGGPWGDDLVGFAEALDRALAVPELFVHYQPRFSLSTDEMCGAEALVRWDCPGIGRLPAADFVHLAANEGAICRVDEVVLEQVCRQLGEWEAREALPPCFWVAVNIAGQDLADPGFPERVAAAIERHGTSPGRLRLEQVYWARAPDHGMAPKAWGALHDLGVGVDLDYFGVGFTSLSELKRKPGRAGIPWYFSDPKDKGDGRVVASTVGLFHTLGVLAVAKRVETASALNWLKDLGCDEGQGFYLGRPASPAVLEGLLRSAL
jgi:EAL domain-containing protein (putative c-di-GMP-specific phosphodiesterase class I)